jgi:hypothetical protein
MSDEEEYVTVMVVINDKPVNFSKVQVKHLEDLNEFLTTLQTSTKP